MFFYVSAVKITCVWKIRKAESGIGTGIETGTGMGTGIEKE